MLELKMYGIAYTDSKQTEASQHYCDASVLTPYNWLIKFVRKPCSLVHIPIQSFIGKSLQSSNF